MHERIQELKELTKEKELIEKVEDKQLKLKKTPDDIKKLQEIIKRIDLNYEKGYKDMAKTLVVEGLAIDKFNKELNFKLAMIYEDEKDYIKAEYIYIDLLKEYENSFEVLKKLGYNLAMQNKLEESLLIYQRAYDKRKNDNEVLEILADLSYELKNYKKSLKYVKLFLKQFPRNTEKLKMKGYCYEMLGEVDKAKESYKRVLDLQPYNSQVAEKLKHLGN